MKKIIIDTNFLLIPGQFKIDIFSEIRRISDFPFSLLVFDKTIDELKMIIKRQKGRQKQAANLGLQLLKRKDLKIIPTKAEKSVDSLILEIADKNTVVATQDAALKNALRKKGIAIITMRAKRHLVIV